MSLSIDDATQNWCQLEEFMDGFIKAWENDPTNPPWIADFLPTAPTAVRSMTLIELIKIDLDQRNAHHSFHPLEWYSGQFPELLHEGKPPDDLIYEEFHIRKSSGHNVDPREYYERFPKNRSALERLLGCYDLHGTTSLSEKKPRMAYQVGDTVDDFELLTKLGQGAFANVFLARQTSMQRLVALKISSDRGNEPQTLAQLEHQHIVRVYDQRRLPEKKLRLLYMQYAPGGTLQEVVARVRKTLKEHRTGKLLFETVNESLDRAGYPAPESSGLRKRLFNASWTETVCRIGVQLAHALDFAHRKGVLHRDVKPANVLLTAECTPKLADFNISFASQLDGASPAAYFGGSLAYMSPEQLEACNTDHPRTPESLDGRADLYSLAAMMWEMLYGERPFREEGLTTNWTQSLVEMTSRRRNEKPVAPKPSASDHLTREVTEVLLRCLSPEAVERPQSGEEFARELALCLQPRSKNLLKIPRQGIRRLASSYPLLAALVMVIVPNALAGVFNFFYNKAAIIEANNIPIPLFETTSLVLNAIYFSFAAVLVLAIIGPVADVVRNVRAGGKVADEDLARRRKFSLLLGQVAASLGGVVWLSSGVVFPLCIHLQVANLDYDDSIMHFYMHFFASMAICGMIAGAYPFFGLTYLMTQVFYPAMIRGGDDSEDDISRFQWLAWITTPYLITAALVPMAGVLVMIVAGLHNSRGTLIGLVIAGMAGIGLAYFLRQRILSDIAALIVAVRPLDMSHSGTDSIDSL